MFVYIFVYIVLLLFMSSTAVDIIKGWSWPRKGLLSTRYPDFGVNFDPIESVGFCN